MTAKVDYEIPDLMAVLMHLGDNERTAAARTIFSQCAEVFCQAVEDGQAGIAQEAGIAGLAHLMGLFPDRNDPAHALLISLMGIITDARAGRTANILLSSGRMITGTKLGAGHTFIGAFAISACSLLSAHSVDESRNKIRKDVAAILAKEGVSNRQGDHGSQKPITNSAIRNWWEKQEQYPVQHLVAGNMLAIHTQNIINRDISSYAEILNYLAIQAIAVVRDSRAM